MILLLILLLNTGNFKGIFANQLKGNLTEVQLTDSSKYLGTRNLHVIPLSPTTALVTWRATWPNAHFNVTCSPRGSQGALPSSVVSAVVGHDISDRHQKTALLTGLSPLKNYTILIQRCLPNNNCAAPIETWVITKTTKLIGSTITAIQATSPSSIYLQWTEREPTYDVYYGYELRCCVYAKFRCFMTETMNTFATLTNLDPDKLYFIHVGSMLKGYGLGMDDIAPVATATVRTWSLTPSAPVLEYGGHTASSVVVQWRFGNSTLEVVQVSQNNETWLDCIDANHCLSSMRRPVEERQLYIEGLLTLSKLEPGSSYVLFVRGCTKQGCGPSTSIAAKTILQVPAAPSIGLLGSSVNTAALNWTFDDTETVLVQVSQNHTTWLNCTDEKDNCKISSLYNWSASHWSGIVTLINLHPGTFYTASVRGCNYYGCGAHNSTDISTAKAAPQEPTDVMLAVLPNGTAVIEWSEPPGHRGEGDVYDISWKCKDGTHRVTFSATNSVSIQDFIPEECQAWVASTCSTDEDYVLRSRKVKAVYQSHFTN